MKQPNLCQKCGKKTNKKVCNVCVGLVIKSIKEEEKRVKKEREKIKIEVKVNENRNALQREINKLSRMIDEKFGFNTCIDCGKPFGKQIDAAHYHDLSTNRGIRYHLEILHSARSNCNQYSSKHKAGYKIGLENRYGKEYQEYVENLQFQYKDLKLNAVEISEKLKLVRHIIRNFDNYNFESSIIARKQLNKIIGIYE